MNVSPLPANTDEDVYCPECDYNLRGLYGDPLACPECGSSHPWGDLRFPVDLIWSQVDRLESLPTGNVAWMFAALGGGLLALSSLPMWTAGVALVVTGTGWIRSTSGLARACRHRPGWRVMLVEMHAAALLLTGTWVAAVVALRFWTTPGSDLIAVLLAMAAFVFGLLGRVVYRDARRRLLRVRRMTAVALAKGEGSSWESIGDGSEATH